MRAEHHTAFDPQRPNLSLLLPTRDTEWLKTIDKQLDQLPQESGSDIDLDTYSTAEPLHTYYPDVQLTIDECDEVFEGRQELGFRMFTVDTGSYSFPVETSEDGLTLALPLDCKSFDPEEINDLVLHKIPQALVKPGNEVPNYGEVLSNTIVACNTGKEDVVYDFGDSTNITTYSFFLRENKNIVGVGFTFTTPEQFSLPRFVTVDNGTHPEITSPALCIRMGYTDDWSPQLMDVLLSMYQGRGTTVPDEVEAASRGVRIIQKFAGQEYDIESPIA